MKRRLFTGVAAAAALAGSLLFTGVSSAAAQDSSTTAATSTGGATANSKLIGKLQPLQVDETKYKVVATLRGVGKQVYDCVGTAWTFREPVAGLFPTTSLIPAGIHGAVQGVPGEGPFWTNFDGSKVVAKPVPATDQVDSPSGSSNIKWLKATTARTAGTGTFSKVAFIQRLDTRGGVAPPGTCNAGSTVARDYTTNYVFWAPKP